MAVTKTLTPIVNRPSTADLDNFETDADGLFDGELPALVTDINTVIGQINSTETNINAKEASATTAASTATSQASIATTKASAAAASATAAYNAQLAAEAIFDNFDDKYLGAKASAPTTDNDGNALTTGALFYKTTAPKGIYVYDAELSAWNIFSFIPTAHGSLSGRSDADVHPISSITGVSAFARTLLDDTDAAAARETLGAAPTVSPTFSGTVTAPTFSGALNGNATTATTAANANKLNGQTWNWSGHGGQPEWVWGGSDGLNMYVYNPANFSVNYATTAWNAMGYGQSWKDVTFSRALNVIYTNTTGKSITIWVQTTALNSVSLQFVVGGISIPAIILTSPSGIYATGSVVVPAGSTYSVLASAYNAWFELR